MSTLWIDADACPNAIKDIILKAVLKRGITTVFVANKPISLPSAPNVSFTQVPLGPDVADHVIATQAQPGDLVITQDIPLAAELIPNGIVVINTHGKLLTASNIGERLSMRDFAHELRLGGGHTGGPRPFNDKDKRQFANTFDQQLAKLFK